MKQGDHSDIALIIQFHREVHQQQHAPHFTSKRQLFLKAIEYLLIGYMTDIITILFLKLWQTVLKISMGQLWSPGRSFPTADLVAVCSGLWQITSTTCLMHNVLLQSTAGFTNPNLWRDPRHANTLSAQQPSQQLVIYKGGRRWINGVEMAARPSRWSPFSWRL